MNDDRQIRSPARRRTARLAVIAALAITAWLASLLPRSVHGLALPAVLVMACLDVFLFRATGSLAFTRARGLDEREIALRDRAYRQGFRLVGLAIVCAFVAAYVGSASIARNAPQIDSGLSGRLLAALVEIVAMMPTFVLAWRGDTRATSQPSTPAGVRRLGGWLAVPILGVAWVGSLIAAPAQATAASTNVSETLDVTGWSCRHFIAGQMVGAGFGGTVGTHVQVCWNGRAAFVYGDPSIPLPAVARPDGLPASVPMFDEDAPSLTACNDTADDFADIRKLTCTARVDAQGTLHYSVQATVTPVPFGLADRRVTLNLVVTRNGTVLAQPVGAGGGRVAQGAP